MKIKMLTLLAGPAGVRQPGSVHDVPTAEAEALIAGGYAEKVKASSADPVLAPEGKPRTGTRRRGRTGTKPEAEEVEETASDEEGEEDPTE